ncbi:DNA-processing protein DprA [Arthrobacter rhombi]|uniref:DNA-processing protein DprA n=1 Tax=Arthrobacter rhombi TaxID=71253 RepID=UPI003FCF3ED0
MSVEAEILVARAGLSRLMEPNDLTGTALVAVSGPVEAYRLITTSTGKAPAAVQQAVAELLGGEAGTRGAHRLDAGLERWRPRVDASGPARDLETIRRFGGGLLVPEDPAWPAQVDDLGLGAPLCLWWRGTVPPQQLPAKDALMAVVGSRDATDYGRQVGSQIVSELCTRGITIVSGGAYGIDARAHEAALHAASGHECLATAAVMAGGLDRFYPAGNDELLRRVEANGMLFAEVPPGTAPTRWRFLQRNRLLAALCGATLVVEARWRSGALTTARRASELGRDVGAVPGSVFSANSAGCHRLLREGSAIPITDAAEAFELLGTMAQPVTSGDSARDTGVQAEETRPHDGLDIQDLLLMDALPIRQPATPDKLSTVSGLGIGAVLGGLSRLQARGLAESSADGWRRRRGG